MSKHINYQTISQNGKPAFVVIPYDEFINILPKIEKKTSCIPNGGIPNEVVRKMIYDDISRIRAWREYLGLTQKEVAKKMSITQAALSQIEAIDSKPRKATLLKLAKIFNVTIEVLR